MRLPGQLLDHGQVHQDQIALIAAQTLSAVLKGDSLSLHLPLDLHPQGLAPAATTRGPHIPLDREVMTFALVGRQMVIIIIGPMDTTKSGAVLTAAIARHPVPTLVATIMTLHLVREPTTASVASVALQTRRKTRAPGTTMMRRQSSAGNNRECKTRTRRGSKRLISKHSIFD